MSCKNCKCDKKEVVKTVYMCGIGWQHEVGETNVDVFPPDLEHMKKLTKHDLEECGVARVEMRFIEWVVPQNIYKNIKKLEEKEEG